MEFKRRATGLELRAEGRRLSGTVLRYGDVAPKIGERFLPGSLQLADAVPLNIEHDLERAIAWYPDGGLTLHDGPDALRMQAELPPLPAADRALAEVRSGVRRGLSIEFRPIDETRAGDGTRVIKSALIRGIAVCRSPHYHQSRVEARARSGRTLRATVPLDRNLQCECIAQGGGGAECAGIVMFQQNIAEPMAAMINRAFEEAQAGVQGRDILAVHKDYSAPIASARRGTLRATPGAQGLEIEADLPAGAVGDAVVSASETAGVVARPLIDYAAEGTEFVDTAEGRIVTAARPRAFLIGSTDARDGWPDARIDYDGETRAIVPVRQQRRVWL